MVLESKLLFVLVETSFFLVALRLATLILIQSPLLVLVLVAGTGPATSSTNF
jgi:hypothetical protein